MSFMYFTIVVVVSFRLTQQEKSPLDFSYSYCNYYIETNVSVFFLLFFFNFLSEGNGKAQKIPVRKIQDTM